MPLTQEPANAVQVGDQLFMQGWPGDGTVTVARISVVLHMENGMDVPVDSQDQVTLVTD